MARSHRGLYFVPRTYGEPYFESRWFSVDLRRSSYLIGPEGRPLGSLALLRKELLWKAITGYTDILANSCFYDLLFSPRVPISLNRRQQTQPSVSFYGAVPTCSWTLSSQLCAPSLTCCQDKFASTQFFD